MSSTARRLALATAAASFGLLASAPVPAAATVEEHVYADSDGAVVHVRATLTDKHGRVHTKETTYVATSDSAYVREACTCKPAVKPQPKAKPKTKAKAAPKAKAKPKLKAAPKGRAEARAGK
jgi:hypothetical protein